MKIGPFVSYIKWPGELGSIGFVFFTIRTFDPARPLFPKIECFIFPVESDLFSFSSSMLYG